MSWFFDGGYLDWLQISLWLGDARPGSQQTSFPQGSHLINAKSCRQLASSSHSGNLAASLGGQGEEGSVPTVDFNIFISARQILINSSCLFHRSMTIGDHPSSLSACCLPNKPHQSLILPLVLYQTVFKPPLEISHIESIIGISTSISSSQLLQSMNLCYLYVVFSAFKAFCLFFPSWLLNLLTSCFPFPAYWTPFASNVRHSVRNKE